MNSLSTGRVAETLQRLFREAEAADGPLIAAFESRSAKPEDWLAEVVEGEKGNLSGYYQSHPENFFNVSPEIGRFLYIFARMRNARRIVEFGTSMGISTIHLAAAVRDSGGGQVIGTELEASKASRARAHLEAAGLDSLVEIREGDARETLKSIEGDIDLVLLDGAFTLYLPILKLLEPHMKPGALIFAENPFAEADGYLAYVRNPENGYVSQALEIERGRVNELTVVT